MIEEAQGRGLTQRRACAALGWQVRTVQLWRKGPKERGRGGNPRPHNALTDEEKAVRASLVARRELADATCRDLSFYALEKENTYISSWSFHKYLVELDANGERVRRPRRPAGLPPATDWVGGPNQLWCWDATRLKTFLRWNFYYLFALQDWFSAFVVAWMVVDREKSEASVELWDEGLSAQGFFEGGEGVKPKSLSDRGSAMKSRRTRLHLSQRQVEQLFSRPRTPNDNPLIESTFGVLKTRPDYPDRFGAIDLATDYGSGFFRWYNFQHKHSRKGYATPYEVHIGKAEEVIRQRKTKIALALEERRLVNLGLEQPATEAKTVD